MGRPNYFDVKYANLETRERYRQVERDAMLYDIAESLKQPYQPVSSYDKYKDINYYKDNIDNLIERKLSTREYEREQKNKVTQSLDYKKERLAQLLCDEHQLIEKYNLTDGLSADAFLVFFVYLFVVFAVLIGKFENLLIIPITLIAISIIAILQGSLSYSHSKTSKKLTKTQNEIESLLDEFDKTKKG